MTRTRLALVVLVVAALAGLLTVGTWAVMGASARSAPALMATGSGPGMMDGRYGGNMMTGGNGMMAGGYGMMAGGYGMMAGGYGLPGDGRPVTTLAAARQRAQVYADELGLRTGEVIWFSNNFYAELLTLVGAGATEGAGRSGHRRGAAGVRPGDDVEHDLRHARRCGHYAAGVGGRGRAAGAAVAGPPPPRAHRGGG
jgi:hypothetical protein